MSLIISWINGVNLGIELYCLEEEMDDGDDWALVLNLLIVSVTIIKHT